MSEGTAYCARHRQRFSESAGCPDCNGTPRVMNEKKPRLFYWEDAENCWAPVPERVDEFFSVDHCSWDGAVVAVEFKRIDMTDEEYDALPEV